MGRKTHKKRVEDDNIRRALSILQSQGFTTREVFLVPYRPIDIFGADILATRLDCFKFIQVTNKQYYQRRADKMKVPMPRWIDRELWVWKDPRQFKTLKKGCFYVYDLEGKKIREEKEASQNNY